MCDVFHRVMQALGADDDTWPIWWLMLVGAIGAELFYKFDLFQLENTWLDVSDVNNGKDQKMIHTIPVMDAVEVPVDESPSRATGRPFRPWLGRTTVEGSRADVDDLLRDDGRQVELIPRFLAIVLSSFSVYAWAMILLLSAAPDGSIPTSWRKVGRSRCGRPWHSGWRTRSALLPPPESACRVFISTASWPASGFRSFKW